MQITDVSNIKIRVANREESDAVQRALFGAGVVWTDGSDVVWNPNHQEIVALYVEGNTISYMSHDRDNYFDNHTCKEVFFYDGAFHDTPYIVPTKELKSMKIRVIDAEQYAAVQRVLLRMGYKWMNGDDFVQYTDRPVLDKYVIVDAEGSGGYGSNVFWRGTLEHGYFEEHKNQEHILLNGQLVGIVGVTEEDYQQSMPGLRDAADIVAEHREIDVTRLKELNTYLLASIELGVKVDAALHIEYNSLLSTLLKYN